MMQASSSTPLLSGVSKPVPLASVDGGQMRTFAYLMLFSQAVLLVVFKIVSNMRGPYKNDFKEYPGYDLFNLSSEYADSVKQPYNVIQVYNYLLGVEVMMFLGFGYLMTFLRWYGLGAAGLTMVVTAYAMELSLMAEPFFENWWKKQVQIDYGALLDANFAAAAVLISFGAVIGKINPTQLWVMVTLNILVYCMNKRVLLQKWLNIKDVGGTISIHEFGAFFGLAVSYVLGTPKETYREKSSTVSDVFSLIGTLSLWIYWPSFVTGILPAYSTQGKRAAVNTILSLLGSTMTTFGLSPLYTFEFRLSPVHIQNATLAGGVVIGATANFDIGPFGALLLGCCAGAISTFSYSFIGPFMHSKFGLHDTCGVLNLHGLPSLFGGIASGIITIWISEAGTPKAQLGGVGITFAVSIASGLITGLIMKALKDDPSQPFGDDSSYWEVADDFETGFDQLKPANSNGVAVSFKGGAENNNSTTNRKSYDNDGAFSEKNNESYYDPKPEESDRSI